MRPYLRVANVFEDRIDLSDVMEMNFTPAEAEVFQLEPGDILLNEGQSKELVGRPAMYRGELPGACFTNSLVRFKSGPGVIPEYALHLYRYWLRSGEFQKIAQITTNIAHLGAGRFAAMEMPLAPLYEQRRIVAKIEELTDRSRRAREALEAVPALLDRFRQSVLAAAFRGDLTAEWRVTNDHSLPDLDYIKIDELGWGHAKAVVACDKVQSGSTPPADQFLREGEIPFLKVYNIVDQEVAFSYRPQFVGLETHHTRLKRSIAYPGDVLMNIVGPPLGKIAIIPDTYPEWNLNQAITLFRVGPHLDNRFLYYYLSQNAVIQGLLPETRGSAGQSNISLTQCRELVLPIPPLEEQRSIVAAIEDRLGLETTVGAVLDAALSRFLPLDQAVLAKAFRGELVPQDPNDESASALLERIRDEKAEAVVPKARRVRKPRELAEARG